MNENSDLIPSGAPEVVVTNVWEASGFLDWNTSLVLMVVLIVLSIAWLLRQRKFLGTKTTWLLAFLRAIAIVVAFWMLAEPSRVRIQTTNHRAELLVLADASGSMDTIDPPEAPLVEDWRVALSEPNGGLAKVQRAQLDLQIASRQHSVDSRSVDDRLIRRAIETLADVVQVNEKEPADRRLDSSLLVACVDSLQSAVDDSDVLSDAATPAEHSAVLASLTDHLDAAVMEMSALRSSMQTNPTASMFDEGRPRKQYVAELLTRFEDQMNQVSKSGATLRRATFTDRVKPLTLDSQDGSIDNPTDDLWASVLETDETDAGSSNQAAVKGVSPRTNLSEALSYARSLTPSNYLSAVLLLSEGQHNAASPTSPVEEASNMLGVPVFTIGIGDRSRRRDVSIHRVNSPAIVFREDRPSVTAVISAYECAGDEVNVTLSSDQEVISTKKIRFPSALCDTEVRFELPPSSIGQKQYQLEVESLDDEVSLQNNHSVLSIQTVKGKLQLMLADLRPRWEQRYLEQLFRRDNRVDLDKLLLKPRLKSTLSLDSSSTELMPTSVDGWTRYDVVILGDVPPEVLTDEVCDAMSAWIKTGGNLIVVAGEYFMPMAYQTQPWFNLLPITAEATDASPGQRPHPTLEGMTHPCIALHKSAPENEALWRRAMSGPKPGYMSPFHNAKPSAMVLASLVAKQEAIGGEISEDFGDLSSRPSWLSVHRVGSGKVAYLSSPISYRFRIRSGDVYHHRFWGQLVRWMTTADLASGDALVDIRSDRSSYDEGQRPGIRVRLSDLASNPVRGGDVHVELSVEGGRDQDESRVVIIPLKENQQASGLYEATLDPLPAGVYHVRATGASVEMLRQSQERNDDDSGAEPEPVTTFRVESSGDLERLITETNSVLLQQISEASGGISIPPAALEEILHVISLDPKITQSKQVTPLWNRWSNLWLMLGCLATDWWIRRRKGLV